MISSISHSTLVNGKWGGWGRWSTCDKTCGGGKMKRERKCDTPAPANGGRNCAGSGKEEKTCNTQTCAGTSCQY